MRSLVFTTLLIAAIAQTQTTSASEVSDINSKLCAAGYIEYMVQPYQEESQLYLRIDGSGFPPPRLSRPRWNGDDVVIMRAGNYDRYLEKLALLRLAFQDRMPVRITMPDGTTCDEREGWYIIQVCTKEQDCKK